MNSVTLPALTFSWQLCRKSKPFTVQFDMLNFATLPSECQKLYRLEGTNSQFAINT